MGGKYTCHIIEDPSFWPNLIGEAKLCDLNLPVSFKSAMDNHTDPVTGIEYPSMINVLLDDNDTNGIYNLTLIFLLITLDTLL